MHYTNTNVLKRKIPRRRITTGTSDKEEMNKVSPKRGSENGGTLPPINVSDMPGHLNPGGRRGLSVFFAYSL